MYNASEKYLTGFMRKECVRKRSSKVGIADRVNNLGAMAWDVAPELFCKGSNINTVG